MDADRRTHAVEMAWLLRYLKVSAFAHLSQAKKPPDVRSLRLDFIAGKQQLDDEDTQSYFDAVQQRTTALKAASLTYFLHSTPRASSVDCSRLVGITHSDKTPCKCSTTTAAHSHLH
eukprot:scaffold226049_cov18-Prasinocladus_malaysianus.AAC.1